MAAEVVAQIMPDGRRLHLQHGPIDIVVEADGRADEIAAAYRQGAAYFKQILPALVEDLGTLRQPLDIHNLPILNGVAGDMVQACGPFSGKRFVTPMAAVAGSVADAIKRVMLKGRVLDKLYINNGGDIAFFLGKGQHFTTGIVDDVNNLKIINKLVLNSNSGVFGIATSGWRGRSFSEGVADAVTILAKDAATADVAATLVAGAVNVQSPRVQRAPASSLSDDTDLGGMLVTTAVEELTGAEVDQALSAGEKRAQEYLDDGLILGAFLSLQGRLISLNENKLIAGRKSA